MEGVSLTAQSAAGSASLAGCTEPLPPVSSLVGETFLLVIISCTVRLGSSLQVQQSNQDSLWVDGSGDQEPVRVWED